MRWVLGIVGVLASLVLLVVVVGYMLPKSHVASVSARVDAGLVGLNDQNYWVRSTFHDVADDPERDGGF